MGGMKNNAGGALSILGGNSNVSATAAGGGGTNTVVSAAANVNGLIIDHLQLFCHTGASRDNGAILYCPAAAGTQVLIVPGASPATGAVLRNLYVPPGNGVGFAANGGHDATLRMSYRLL